MSNVLQVGMTEYKVAASPNILMTAGLGSCIGVCLWDSTNRVGGLAHVMLPSSSQARKSDNKGKFADTAVPTLISEMTKKGTNPANLVAKIAGGAQMFKLPGTTDILKIGERNAQAVQEALRAAKIRILISDVGGNSGRTIMFMPEDGSLVIRTLEHGERVV